MGSPATGSFNAISVCVGGGGLDLAVELAIPSARIVVGVERESWAVAHLVEAMRQGLLAEAPIWSDVTTFRGRPWRGVVDFFFGGIPCQPHSLAGNRDGEDDERDLWSDARRIIAQARPRVVLIENVQGMLTSKPGAVPGAERVWRDLRRMGYEVEGGLFTAAEVGAKHERRRVFILGILRDALAHPMRPRSAEDAGDDGEVRRVPAAQRGSEDGAALPGRGGADGFGGHGNSGAEGVVHAFGSRWQAAGSRPVLDPGPQSEPRSIPVEDAEGGAGRLHEGQGRSGQRAADSGRGSRSLADVSNGIGWGGVGRTQEGVGPRGLGWGRREGLGHLGAAAGDGRQAGDLSDPVAHAEPDRRGRWDAAGGAGGAGGAGSALPPDQSMVHPIGGHDGGRPDIEVGGPEGRIAFAVASEGPLHAPGPGEIDRWRAILARWPQLEPAVRRDTHELAPWVHAALVDRVDRLRLLGNGVDPLQGAYAIRTLAHRLAARAAPGQSAEAARAGAVWLVSLMDIDHAQS